MPNVKQMGGPRRFQLCFVVQSEDFVNKVKEDYEQYRMLCQRQPVGSVL